MLSRHKYAGDFGLQRDILHALGTLRIIVSEEGRVYLHASENGCVPFPAILGPNSEETSLFTVAEDLWAEIEFLNAGS